MTLPRLRWPRRLRIWSLSVPGVGTIIRPGSDGFADVPTLRRRTYLRVWALPLGYALIRSTLRKEHF